jgi:predicted alpha/beta-fold hydrolase
MFEAVPAGTERLAVDLDAAVATMRAAPFAPPLWLRGPHGQTLLGTLLPRRPIPTTERIWIGSDPGTKLLCGINRLPGRRDGALLIVHGMAGSIDSGAAVDLARAALGNGLDAVRMNMRNCGETEAYTPTLYNANLHQDVSAVVRHLIDVDGVRRIGLVGYSMGGNLILNYLGNMGDAVPAQVIAAMVICPAVDSEHCVSLLDGRVSNRVYREHFVRQLARLYLRKSQLDPRRFPAERIRLARTVRAFDAAATAPDAGFARVEDFYAWVTAAPRLKRIAVPTIVLQAEDDPFVALLPSTRALIEGARPLRLVNMAAGGHCGFLGSGARRWAAEHAARFAASAMAG